MASELEKKSLDEAFAGAIANAFDVLSVGYIDAKGDKAKETDADARFKGAVAIARRAYQQAQKLL